ncbi:PiggyBac transposable element-derived protein 4 [Anabarilius grahami]|uniref:PiggyBac transposable element-derived protein 4 n=1 Tax=Anabarilius grahami TaxID=495550 RepID=A0A3N0YG75_ANAGA|nr:PiggyBac transposable element-derived protein 4 [Anabarilius grahami]
MFPLLHQELLSSGAKLDTISPLIQSHLEHLQGYFREYFPDLDSTHLNWAYGTTYGISNVQRHAESDSGSDSLSDSDEEAHLPENLAGCDRSNEPAVPDNAVYASEGAVFLPTWTSDLFSPPDLDFDNTGKGVQDSQTNPSEADCFKLFMNEPIVEQVVQKTNKYAYQLKESATVPGKLAKWAETTVNEIYTFLAAVIVMGLVRKGSLRDYWTTDPVMQTPFFPTLFSLDRFQVLLRAPSTLLTTLQQTSEIL